LCSRAPRTVIEEPARVCATLKDRMIIDVRETFS
jgi:hypothetical protein